MAKKVNELREQTVSELQEKTHSLKKQLFDLRNQAKTGTIEKPNEIRILKRRVAQILTVIREKVHDTAKNNKN